MEDQQPGVTEETRDAPPADPTPPAQPDGSQEPPAPSPSPTDQPDEEKDDLTDRGTKKAKEPASQFYQQIKNENADMRALLSNPQALKEYLRQLDGTNAPKDGETDDLADIGDKILTPDGQIDLAKLVQFMEERWMRKIDQGIRFQTENQIRSREIENGYNSDKASVRKDHPELDPTSKSFDADLEQFVGERFIAQGGLEGRVTLRDVVTNTYAYLDKVRGVGRQQAETEIVRKQVGAIPQSNAQADEAQADDDGDPATVLANRVHKSVTGAKAA